MNRVPYPSVWGLLLLIAALVASNFDWIGGLFIFGHFAGYFLGVSDERYRGLKKEDEA